MDVESSKKLRFLYLESCIELKIFPNLFENMAALEEVAIFHCPELDWALMDKILKLQNCYAVKIYGSTKLLEKWKHMWSQIQHPIAVFTGLRLNPNVSKSLQLIALNPNLTFSWGMLWWT